MAPRGPNSDDPVEDTPMVDVDAAETGDQSNVMVSSY